MHFFIDHTQLPIQTTANAKFGPVSEQLFNISTKFQLTAQCKAFATQKGLMIVQKNNDDPANLVNAVIKPITPVRINGISVKYYYYRGLLFNSFFNSSGNIIPSTSTEKTEFINSFWKNEKNTPLNTSPLNIGYGDAFLLNLLDSRPLKDIFNNKALAVPYVVEEGMWIGNFAANTQIAFDIEIETDSGIHSTLGTSRTSGIVINTNNLTGQALKRAKERILTYVDPAAFWGTHCDAGVNVTIYTGTTKNPPVAKKGARLYQDIISKFLNKNRIYLDIRSERGLSYNFYDTYKVSDSNPANIKINNNETVYGTTDTPIFGWPIYFFETISQYNTTINKTIINLCKNENANPVLYLENKDFSTHLINDAKKVNFYKGNKIATSSEPVWTNPITLYYPNAQDTGRNNIANYIKLSYFVGDPVTEGTNRLANQKYFDSAFCSIDLENIGDFTVQNGHVENAADIYIKEQLQGDGTGNFAYAARTGAYWDTNRILFYCQAYNKGNSTGDRSGKYYLPTIPQKLSLNNSKYDSLKRQFDIVCKRYKINNNEANDIKILGLNNYIKERKFQEKENLILLGLTIAELQILKVQTGLSANHQRYIFLDPDFTTDYLFDVNGCRYYKYRVKVQGLDVNGIPAIIDLAYPIIVYSRDKQFFSSAAFAANEQYSMGHNYEGDNRIEFRIFNDGAIYINDNIDLSLVKKQIVNGLTKGIDNDNNGDSDVITRDNYAPLYSFVSEDSVAGDTSSPQKIYYLYYDMRRGANIDSQTPKQDLCGLDIIMENRREKSTPTGAAASASTEQSFNSLGYLKTLDFREFNAIGVNAHTSYKNTSDDIITRGLLPKTKTVAAHVGNIKYIKKNNKIFMIHVNKDSIIENLRSHFKWEGTVRCFARPDLFAVFLGAIREIITTLTSFNGTPPKKIKCGGFAFQDASSFPSTLHVNGDAFDTNYIENTPANTADDLVFIRALHKYGKGKFRIGPARSSLRNEVNSTPNSRTGILWVDGGTLHDSHLHTEDIIIST